MFLSKYFECLNVWCVICKPEFSSQRCLCPETFLQSSTKSLHMQMYMQAYTYAYMHICSQKPTWQKIKFPPKITETLHSLAKMSNGCSSERQRVRWREMDCLKLKIRSFRAIYKYNIDQGEEDGGAFQVGQLFLRRQEIPGSKVERYVLPTCLHYSLLTLVSIQRVTKCFHGWLQKRVSGWCDLICYRKISYTGGTFPEILDILRSV